CLNPIRVNLTPSVPEWMMEHVKVHYREVSDKDEPSRNMIDISWLMKEMRLTPSDAVVKIPDNLTFHNIRSHHMVSKGRQGNMECGDSTLYATVELPITKINRANSYIHFVVVPDLIYYHIMYMLNEGYLAWNLDFGVELGIAFHWKYSIEQRYLEAYFSENFVDENESLSFLIELKNVK
ncbi:hypothetical protein KI387_041351, partial [Taxus chinensis]